jgi:hypothetical protein
MAAKKGATMQERLLEEIEKANPARRKGKFLADGRHILKVHNAGLQEGENFDGWVVDAEILATTADSDPTGVQASNVGDPVVIMWQDNKSLPSNLKGVEQSLACSSGAVLDGSALSGKMVRVTATLGQTKAGKPFTFVYFEGYASSEDVDAMKQASPHGKSPSQREPQQPLDDEPPF